MNTRDFYLLVRKYFNARDVAHFPSDSIQASEAVLMEAENEKQIRKELERFTKEEIESLPFKD